MPDPFDQQAEDRFVAAVLRGEQEAIVVFETRIRCIPRIMGALNARRGRPFREHDLADLAQNTIVIALRKLPEYKPLAPVESWLYRLCCNEFLNALRQRERDRRVVNDSDEVDSFAGNSTERATTHDEVHLALERLGGLEAETIRLKHFDGLTFVEIAARMGTPENTVKTRYYRGLARLEQLLTRIETPEES
jgi:RNA polymerase sigma-70 factor (ECF subfamily)